MRPSIGRSRTPASVLGKSSTSCLSKSRVNLSSGPRVPSLRSEVYSKGTDRHGVVARIASLEADQATERRHGISAVHEEHKDTFDWERQWYPLAFVNYLDPKVPHAKELLGMRLVLWRDSGGTWRCFEDKCPHRLAPLSEGRIEPSDGTLMCSYHGWRFDGEAKCTDIPQSLDAKANAAACNNPRSCAIARPTKVLQGMIFVWGKSGPSAVAEAAAKPPLGIPDLEMTEGIPSSTVQGVPTIAFLPGYYRELPYGWEVLAENLMDPSHLPFAHHGVLNRRDDDKAGHYRMDVRHSKDSPTSSTMDVISVAGESVRPRVGDLQGRAFQFNPPSLIRWYTYLRDKGDANKHETLINIITFYVIPVAPGKSAVLFQGYYTATGIKSLPLPAKLFFTLRPLWSAHCFIHMVFDGDSKILYMQERLLVEASRTGKSSWQRKYYMPAQADRLVAAFRKWLDERGGGGPPTRLPQQLPPLEDREEAFLDRFDQHTRHCPNCLGAVRNFERLRIAAIAAGVTFLLALSSALGRGTAPLSPIPVGLAAGALVSLAVWNTAGRFLKKFYFVGYNHSET